MSGHTVVSLAQARSFWTVRQGLSDSPTGPIEETVAATGWARTLGGIDVYLALRARRSSLTRAELDGAVADRKLHVAPAVRGCIYLVPTRDLSSVMALASDLSRPRTTRDLERVDSGWEEIADVAEAAAAALANGPLSTTGIRKALGAGALRSYGNAGKKVGLSSPLPVALRELEFDGRIRRTPVGERLDTERYDWELLEDHSGWEEEQRRTREDRIATICSRFLSFFGPATVREMADWVGVPQRDVKTALLRLDVVSVTIDSLPGDFHVLADDLVKLRSVEAPRDYRFLSFEDNLLTVHGGPGLLSDPACHELTVPTWGGRGKSMPLGSLKHLGLRAIMRGAELAGFWEFDPDKESIVTATIAPVPAGEESSLQQATEKLASFIRAEMGHGRSFSLDSDEALRERAGLVRAMK